MNSFSMLFIFILIILLLSKSFSFTFTPLLQINLGIYVQDSSMELSVLVDRSVGGTSLADGQIELMLHRFLTSLTAFYDNQLLCTLILFLSISLV